MAEVGSKDPLTRRVYQSYIGAVRRRLQFTAQRYLGARHRLRICGRGAYLRRDRTETGMVNAVLNQLARRAAGGGTLPPVSPAPSIRLRTCPTARWISGSGSGQA